MFISQEIGLGLVSLEMIFEALQSEPFRLNFHSLSSKIPKIPDLSLVLNIIKRFCPLQTACGLRTSWKNRRFSRFYDFLSGSIELFAKCSLYL